ncbi:MAG: SDR family oxidoreductase [Thermomicrobiales bacterium]|nr:SDR family oxidoreductase [Thermomicrobiales bacterium]
MRLSGKIAVVTGAGSGIGRAIAQRFAAEGARVVVAGRTRPGIEETARAIDAAGGEALAVVCDVTDAAAVTHAIARANEVFGPVDILVNNAGGSFGDDILTFDEDTWDRNFDLVLKSVYLCCREVLPQMIARGSGAIVNIGSVNGLTGIGEEAYGAAKAGMINLTQNMAMKYGPHGVRANVVAPGTIRTPIWNERLAERPNVFEALTAWYPLGRVGEPEDVANAALFLASDEASWITGVTLPVDGGLLAGSYRMNVDLSGGATSQQAPVSSRE